MVETKGASKKRWTERSNKEGYGGWAFHGVGSAPSSVPDNKLAKQPDWAMTGMPTAETWVTWGDMWMMWFRSVPLAGRVCLAIPQEAKYRAAVQALFTTQLLPALCSTVHRVTSHETSMSSGRLVS